MLQGESLLPRQISIDGLGGTGGLPTSADTHYAINAPEAISANCSIALADKLPVAPDSPYLTRY